MRRWIWMPVAAVVLVTAVVGVQVASGGGSFEPLRPADPCAERALPEPTDDLEGLTEALVLRGVDAAACTLGVSREQLTLDLATSGERTAEEVEAIRQGLVTAVADMSADGTLPPASALVDEALDATDLNGFLKTAIRALPDAVVDAALKTDDVLTRAITDLDLDGILSDVTDREAWEAEIGAAVEQAVKDSLEARLRNLI